MANGVHVCVHVHQEPVMRNICREECEALTHLTDLPTLAMLLIMAAAVQQYYRHDSDIVVILPLL